MLDSSSFTITCPVTSAQVVFLQNSEFPRNPKEVKRLEPIATTGCLHLLYNTIKYPE